MIQITVIKPGPVMRRGHHYPILEVVLMGGTTRLSIDTPPFLNLCILVIDDSSRCTGRYPALYIAEMKSGITI
jgi:hypothetical protein